MDSQTAHPDTPDALATMLQNASIDKAEGNEFSNPARDMFKFVLNYHNNTRSGSALPTGSENTPLEFHDAMNYFLNAVPLFLEEVRKNDQLRSAAAETTSEDASDPVVQPTTTDQSLHSFSPEEAVDVIDIVPSEPSLLPVANVADRYARSMLKCLTGYPLYNPKPFCELSNEYVRHGVKVGDVGFVREDGTFDFLFNICSSQNGSVNPTNLPDGFSLDISDHPVTRELEPLPRNTCFFQRPVSKAKSGEYICEGDEGAVLELPEGAIGEEATNIHPFEMLAMRHGVEWYKYTIARGRKISNGSLYLITSFTKCSQWGIAVFDRVCIPGQGLKFEKKKTLPFGKSTPKYQWKGPRTFSTKVSNIDKIPVQNQCIFVRGYKIMIRQDIFDDLCKDQLRIFNLATTTPRPQAENISMTRQRATRIRGGAGPDPLSRVTKGLFSGTAMTKSDEEVVLQANFNSSLVHPSDLINVALLSQYPGAKVSVTHDNVWCDLLRNNFQKFDYGTLINIAQSYTVTITEYGTETSLLKGSKLILDISDGICLKRISETLRRSVTLPEDNFIPTLPSVSRALPRELVERILLLLDAESLLTCRLVDKAFNEIIQSSMMLQYFLACKAAGVVDNPQSRLSYAERLKALNKWEDAWRILIPVFETTIKVNYQLGQTSMFYNLVAGNYFLSDKDRKDLYRHHLPSSPNDNPGWIMVPCEGLGKSRSGLIDDAVAAIPEHDLMVNVISSEVGNQQGMRYHSLDLVLLKFSTGEYHPLAHHPRIHVQRSDLATSFVNTSVVGDNIALLVGGHQGTLPDKLFIFEWKTGHKRLEHKTIDDAYGGLVFVSPELLLVPNHDLNVFEVWYLPSSDTSDYPAQILSLKIPAISDNYTINGIFCHGDPSPFLFSMPYLPQRTFSPAPEDSIIIANIRFRILGQSAYALIMHRRALLDTIQKWKSPSVLVQHPQTLSMNEVIVSQVVSPDDESVKLSAKSVAILDDFDGSSFATEPISSNFPTSAESESLSIFSQSPTKSRHEIPVVKWKDWGPPISRWFKIDRTHAWRIHRSIGQRYVLLDSNSHNKRIIVADFNPYNVRRNEERMERLKNGEIEDNGNKKDEDEENEEEQEVFDHEGVFTEEVYMGLKCVVYRVQGEYDFDAVLMDEERLLGLKVDHEGSVESIKVLYIG